MPESATDTDANSTDTELEDISIDGLRAVLDAVNSEIHSKRDAEPNSRLAGRLAFAEDSIENARLELAAYQTSAETSSSTGDARDRDDQDTANGGGA